MPSTKSNAVGRLRLSLVVAGLACLAACASHPKPPLPAPSHAAPPVAEAPPPRAAAPPAAPIESRPLPGSVQDFVVNVGDRVYFDLDQFNLRADAEPVLAAQAAWLVRYPSVQVRIEGNADERGTREYNFALGARRANSVKQFLILHGVASSRIATISYGKERPIDPASSEAAWAKNRNAHTAITQGAR
ncbi:peptidoglycan-associated lipoprotein Pal [Caulobacter sp. KR2-114]|uniref:peptidoglycan-associated lipoprotein Pal n=1 Tax=Caulobacter sp. KR2-114 TaxID=3400912 RepID=UPI003BFABF60